MLPLSTGNILLIRSDRSLLIHWIRFSQDMSMVDLELPEAVIVTTICECKTTSLCTDGKPCLHHMSSNPNLSDGSFHRRRRL